MCHLNWFLRHLGRTPPLIGIAIGLLAPIQTHAGEISGRVFNPATREYVNRAEIRVEDTNLVVYSTSDGTFHITGINPGEYSLTITYTGYHPQTKRVVVTRAKPATQDFEIKPMEHGSQQPGNEPLQLSAFTVSAEREGNAKAIMEQRAAINARNVVASDTYGEGTDGNVGEFIKFMPGIVIDYGSPAARGAMIGGLV